MYRNSGIDAIRIVAAFLVIALHVGAFTEFAPAIGDAIRVSARWCVPFFFIAIGFFLPKSEQLLPEVPASRLFRYAACLLVASVVFLPYAVVLMREQLSELISPVTLLLGTYHHLWFFGSLVTGLTIIAVLRNICGTITTVAVASVMLVFLILEDITMARQAIGFSDEFLLGRHLQSVPLVLVGWWLAKRPLLSMSQSIGLMAVGFAIQAFEAAGGVFFGVDPSSRTFLIGTLPSAVGLFYVGLNVGTVPKWLSWAGQRLTVAVYVLHPLFVDGFRILFRLFDANPPSTVLWLITSVCVLASAVLIERLVPGVARLLNGQAYRETDHLKPAANQPAASLAS